MKRFIYILLILALLSCDSESGPVYENKVIEFAVSTPGVKVTKAEVSVDQLKQDAGQNNLYLYAAKSDGSTSSVIAQSPGARMHYVAERNVWDAKHYVDIVEGGIVTGQNEVNIEWEDNLYYTFYAYAFSSNANANSDLIIANSAFGRQFTVTQPEGGDGTGTIDYLLSSLVNVAPTTTHPLVPIQLEHAMARIDVDVQIADAMYSGAESIVKDISITISGIKRKATMLCLQPKAYGEEGTNTWHVTFDNNTSTADYTKSIDNSESNREGYADATENDMSFMALPVTNSEMTGYELILEYNNHSKTEPLTPKDYRYTFALKDYSPNGWVNGHKVKYVLTIDNSIHLKGTVVDYQDVDYIEAVLVPDIPGVK